MFNKLVYYLAVLFVFFSFVGCTQYHYFYSPDCVENVNLGFGKDCQDMTGKWFYASDSLMVYNADLDRLDRSHVKNRVFSSKDIERIRKELSIPNEYFWIVEANTVNLSNKRGPNEKTFDIIQTQTRHFFYVIIPCSKKRGSRTRTIDVEIPVTYIDTTFIIHTKRKGRWNGECIRKNVSADIDMDHVEKWLIRCKLGRMHRPHRWKNKSIRYMD